MWKRQVVRVGYLRKSRNLIRRIHGAHLAGLGDADCAGLSTVNELHVETLTLDIVGAKLAVSGGHRPQLQARHRLGRSTLIDVNVGAGRADDRLPTLVDRLQCDDIGSRSVEHGKELGIGTKALPHQAPCLVGHDVIAIRRLVTNVDRAEGFEHLRVHTRVVIARESAPQSTRRL